MACHFTPAKDDTNQYFSCLNTEEMDVCHNCDLPDMILNPEITGVKHKIILFDQILYISEKLNTLYIKVNQLY